jgi:hypothetical protein
VKSVSSVAKLGDGDVGGESWEHISGVCESVSDADRLLFRKLRLTEHAESERFRLCACSACASYVYVMRKRS